MEKQKITSIKISDKILNRIKKIKKAYPHYTYNMIFDDLLNVYESQVRIGVKKK